MIQDDRFFAREPGVVSLSQPHHLVRGAGIVSDERQRRRNVPLKRLKRVEVGRDRPRAQMQFR